MDPLEKFKPDDRKNSRTRKVQFLFRHLLTSPWRCHRSHVQPSNQVVLKVGKDRLMGPTWLSKYRLPPTIRTNTAIPRNVAPRGFPKCRSRAPGSVFTGFRPFASWMDVFSLKSWVMAMPIEAKANEVRSQARKVRSGCAYCQQLNTLVWML